MSEALNITYDAIDQENAEESALTRRKLVGGAAVSLGSLGVLGLVNNDAWAARAARNSPQTILNVAATAEVLATIVNTVGAEKLTAALGTDETLANVRAAAREELIHYNVLTSIGGKPLTTKIWVPDKVFATRNGLLNALEAGDQIFINAYLIGTTTFGEMGDGRTARYTAEFMGAEAVHRALARQSLGKLGNDRVFMKFNDRERAPGAPNKGQKGFRDITKAVDQLQAAGFGFGEKGAKPGKFYQFDEVKKRTPMPKGLNQLTLD